MNPNESPSSDYYRMASRSKYSSEWNGLALQSELSSMGSAVTIGLLIMVFGEIPKGR